MSNMIVKVELLPGTSIKEAISEAKNKAIMWNVAYVKFDFNGIAVSVRQNTDVDVGVDKWHHAYKNQERFIIC